MYPIPGSHFGSVVVDAQVGVGGTASVHRCHDAETGEVLALKVATEETVERDPAARARFRREVEALRTLDHTAIVGLRDADTEATPPWMVMDYVDGQTLDSYRRGRGGRIPLHEAALLLWPVADALDHAHRCGFVHRDIKPHNILVPKHPRGGPSAVLTDFGIAAEDGDGGLTRTGLSVGTARYMSPEQRNGDPVTYGSDQYALSLVLCELVTGVVPVHGAAGLFSGSTSHEVRRLRGALGRSLAAEPERRFPSCTEFLEAVSDAASRPATSNSAAQRPRAPRPEAHPAPRTGPRPVSRSGPVGPPRPGYPPRGPMRPQPGVRPGGYRTVRAAPSRAGSRPATSGRKDDSLALILWTTVVLLVVTLSVIGVAAALVG